MGRDLLCGLIALALAGVYLNESTKIQVSALGDTVGSAGFPSILGSLLAGTALLLLLQSVLAGRKAGANEPAADADGETAPPGVMFRRAAGLAAIAAAVIAVLAFGGYVVSVALLLAAVMLFQGLPFSRRTALVAGGGGLVLYGLFGLLLGIPVPKGLWASFLG